MRFTKRAKVLAVTAVAGIVVGAAGIAVAAYLSNVNSTAVAGAAETWTSPSIVGKQISTPLLPGDPAAAVTLTVTNPNTNLAAQVVGVTANDDITVTLANGDTSGAVVDTCKGYLVQGATVSGSLPTIPAAGSADIVITDGIVFTDAGPTVDQSACQGMTFSGTWSVQFRAVRS